MMFDSSDEEEAALFLIETEKKPKLVKNQYFSVGNNDEETCNKENAQTSGIENKTFVFDSCGYSQAFQFSENTRPFTVKQDCFVSQSDLEKTLAEQKSGFYSSHDFDPFSLKSDGSKLILYEICNFIFEINQKFFKIEKNLISLRHQVFGANCSPQLKDSNILSFVIEKLEKTVLSIKNILESIELLIDVVKNEKSEEEISVVLDKLDLIPSTLELMNEECIWDTSYTSKSNLGYEFSMEISSTIMLFNSIRNTFLSKIVKYIDKLKYLQTSDLYHQNLNSCREIKKSIDRSVFLLNTSMRRMEKEVNTLIETLHKRKEALGILPTVFKKPYELLLKLKNLFY